MCTPYPRSGDDVLPLLSYMLDDGLDDVLDNLGYVHQCARARRRYDDDDGMV